MGVVRTFIENNKFKTENLPSFEARLFFEGDKRRADLERFTVLLFLSTIIATYGVIGDSVAVVIGAMIIAPLMRPIMATVAGLLMGDLKRAWSSFLIVLASVTGVIVVSWLLTELSVVTVISVESNVQFYSRISPGLIDLYAALWSGAAAAFALSREDVADSLPGVAIAISLVPPLCVVGIGLAEGEWAAAGGAFMLFLTNFLSILFAGGGVLALLGLNSVAFKGLNQYARRSAFVVIAISIALVAIPLGTTTIRAYEQKLLKRETFNMAQEWIRGTDYGIRDVEVKGKQVTLVIFGSGEQPELPELADSIHDSIGEPVYLKLVVVPSREEFFVAK